MNDRPNARFDAIVLVGVGALVLGTLVGLLVRRAIDRRMERLAEDNQAVISTRSAYFGGDVLIWNRGAFRLESAEVVAPEASGEAAAIVIRLGYARWMKNLLGAAQVGAAIAGKPPVHTWHKMAKRIPIPPGKEADAHKIAWAIRARAGQVHRGAAEGAEKTKCRIGSVV